MTTKTKAIIYTRQSVHREESISHQIQEQACRQYAISRGYEVVRVETDPGISGLNLTKRKALARSLESVEAGEATVIIVWRWSRLSRSRTHQAKLLSDVEESGGQVESALEPMESSAAGRFGRDVLLAMAAFESEQKSETWKQAHAWRLSQGLAPQGQKKFGYRRLDKYGKPFQKDSRESSARYDLDPVTAPLVEEGYAMYLRGIGFKNIGEYWTKKGTISNGDVRWSKDTVRRTLDDVFATGQIKYKGALIDGAHPAIISEGVWKAYLSKRKERAALAPRSKSSTWAFSGFVVCSRCGHGMVKNTSGNNTYLFCTHRRKSNGCIGVTALMEQVNLSIWNWFGSHLQEWADALPSEVEAVKVAEVAVQDAAVAKDAAQGRIDGLMSRAVRFDMSDADIEAPLKEFRAELSKALEALDAALTHQASYVPVSGLREAIETGSENLTVPEWREAIGKVLAGVAVMPDRSILLVPRGENVKTWG
ncbi:recombinase family protein [Arthrobacter alpinus]|uniref:recombinase family protein n=1 Tax=Arthrobacter alpinus TaxID=656366 RepID=UPI001645DBB4|nr:recombinase family protein [Arthrobacter alpinus]